jgi:hypothetical protein
VPVAPGGGKPSAVRAHEPQAGLAKAPCARIGPHGALHEGEDGARTA